MIWESQDLHVKKVLKAFLADDFYSTGFQPYGEVPKLEEKKTGTAENDEGAEEEGQNF